MGLDFSALDWLAKTSGAHLNSISFAMVATLLAIFGQDMNRALRSRTRHLHFVWRTLAFIFLCAFGYGWLTLYVSPKLGWALRHVPPRALPVAIVLLFVILGIIAERKRKI